MRLSSLFDRLWLNNNEISSVPASIGQLTNLTKYGIHFEI